MTVAQSQDMSIRAIQLDQALFELRHGLGGDDRMIDRLVVGLLVGRPVMLAGPAGVGKRFAAEAVGRVFGLATEVDHLVPERQHISLPGPAGYKIIAGVERATPQAMLDLATDVAPRDCVNLVVTTRATQPSQLSVRLRDETLMYVEVDYPDAAAERDLALRATRPGRAVDTILRPGDLAGIRELLAIVGIDDAVLDYAVRLVQATRAPSAHRLENLADLVVTGASPRATVALVRAARGMALLRGRHAVTAQDVYDTAYEVLLHRIELSPAATARGIGAADVLVELLSRVPANLSGAGSATR